MPYFLLFIALVLGTISLQAQHQCGPSCQAHKQQMQALRQYWEGGKSANQPAINTNSRSDSFDILHYQVDLDMRTSQQIRGYCELRFRPLLSGLQHLPLDLLGLTVDSVVFQGQNLSYQYNDTLLRLNFPSVLSQNDTFSLRVYYQGRPGQDAQWGGFYFDGQYAFNLGVGFSADPHNFGRVWHPCFDNFAERATYGFHIRSLSPHKAQCNGYLVQERDSAGIVDSYWQMDTPIPTYLACIALAPYAVVRYELAGMQGPVSVALAAVPGDTSPLKQAFVRLPAALSAMEYWFGPHRWHKIGYSLVPFNAGAMEHATNIAYPRIAIGANSIESLMAHELAHSWWGNWTTCETSEDMWINEGMAAYCEHLFFEEAYGRARYETEVKRNHYNVLQNAHIQEGGYRPISGMPQAYTYGTHTYKKGAAVAHNLRYYLGDSLYRLGMTRVLDSFPLRTINSSELRDALTAFTGYDLTDFFRDWVFGPGFPHFELGTFQQSQVGGQTQSRLSIQQKLIGRSAFHENVPLEITAIGAQGQVHRQRFVVSGEWDTVSMSSPFVPLRYILNERHGLLQGRMDAEAVISQTGINNFASGAQVESFQVMALPSGDSAWFHWAYHPVPPTPWPSAQPSYTLSAHRFWTLSGHWPMGTEARYRFETSAALDSNIWARGSDSLILLYRPDANSEWREHPDYNRVTLPGSFYLRANTLLAGDYAIGYGSNILAVQGRQDPPIALKLFPNPAKDQVQIEWKQRLGQNGPTRLELYDSQGRLVREQNLGKLSAGAQSHSFSLQDLPQGLYFLKLRQGHHGQIGGTAKLRVE